MANGQLRTEEYQAAEILRKHFPTLFSDSLRYSDMPDLQDDVKNVGIEVVQNLRYNQGRAHGFLGEFENCDENSIPKEKIENLRKIGYKPFIYGGKLKGIMCLKPYVISCDGILADIEKKIGKLQKGNYRIFKSNRLFIYVMLQAASFERYQVLELVSKVQKLQENIDMQFDVIYIYDEYNGEYDLWTCYLKSGLVRKYKPKNTVNKA